MLHPMLNRMRPRLSLMLQTLHLRHPRRSLHPMRKLEPMPQPQPLRPVLHKRLRLRHRHPLHRRRHHHTRQRRPRLPQLQRLKPRPHPHPQLTRQPRQPRRHTRPHRIPTKLPPKHRIHQQPLNQATRESVLVVGHLHALRVQDVLERLEIVLGRAADLLHAAATTPGAVHAAGLVELAVDVDDHVAVVA
jgi:hypothetical protein